MPFFTENNQSEAKRKETKTAPLSEDFSVFLRALEPEDLDLLYKIENDQELWSVGSFNMHYSRFALKEYIASCSNDIYERGQLRLAIALKTTKKTIGLIDLFDFSAIDSRAEIGIALLTQHQGKGLAGEALKLLEDYAQKHLNLRMLCAKTSPTIHKNSMKLFLANGYIHQATLPAWYFFNGKYEDVALLCKFFDK